MSNKKLDTTDTQRFDLLIDGRVYGNYASKDEFIASMEKNDNEFVWYYGDGNAINFLPLFGWQQLVEILERDELQFSYKNFFGSSCSDEMIKLFGTNDFGIRGIMQLVPQK